MKCQYLGNEIKYDAEVCYVEVAYDAYFTYGIEIRINWQNRSNLITSSFKRQENMKCQYLGNESSVKLKFGR